MSQAIWKMSALLIALVAASCKPLPESFDRTDTSVRPAASSSYPQGTGAAPLDPVSATGAALPARTIKVGLLVPLSGASNVLGKSLQDAGVMALFDKYSTLSEGQQAVRVELVPVDTKGTPQGARQAAADAMKEGAELLIGPVFSQEVEAIAPLAKSGKVAILTFSNNTQVAGNGVFTLGFSPEEQTKRVARYAFLKGSNRMAVLAPNDAYGRTVVDAAGKEAELLGRKLAPVIRYSPAGGTLNDDIKTLSKEGAQGVGLAFDALLLPEGSDKLTPILRGLNAANVTPRNVQFVGTGLWDDRDLIRKNDLNGALLASSPPLYYEAFEERFKHMYGYKPPRIASLAYDAVALAATLATTHGRFDAAALADANGFMGPANGIFRLKADGAIERGLAVLRVKDGGFEVVDPAPVSFQ